MSHSVVSVSAIARIFGACTLACDVSSANQLHSDQDKIQYYPENSKILHQYQQNRTAARNFVFRVYHMDIMKTSKNNHEENLIPNTSLDFSIALTFDFLQQITFNFSTAPTDPLMPRAM